jgi:hypothetical protein
VRFGPSGLHRTQLKLRRLAQTLAFSQSKLLIVILADHSEIGKGIQHLEN